MAKKVLVDWKIVKEFLDKDNLINGNSPSNPNEIAINGLHSDDERVMTTNDHADQTTQNRAWYFPNVSSNGTMREETELNLSMLSQINQTPILVQYNSLKEMILQQNEKNNIIDIIISDLSQSKDA